MPSLDLEAKLELVTQSPLPAKIDVAKAMAKYKNSPVPIFSVTVNGCECIVNGRVESFSSPEDAKKFVEYLQSLGKTVSEPIFQVGIDTKLMSFFAQTYQVVSRVDDPGQDSSFKTHNPTVLANEVEILSQKPGFYHLQGLDKAIAKAYDLKRYRLTLPDDSTVEVWCFADNDPVFVKTEAQKKLKQRIGNGSYKRIEEIDPPDDAP